LTEDLKRISFLHKANKRGFHTDGFHSTDRYKVHHIHSGFLKIMHFAFGCYGMILRVAARRMAVLDGYSKAARRPSQPKMPEAIPQCRTMVDIVCYSAFLGLTHRPQPNSMALSVPIDYICRSLGFPMSAFVKCNC